MAIRFTGRVYSKDVGDVLDRIVKFNGIDDVARIPIGYRVKIPMSLLLPEYLPADDPTRVAERRGEARQRQAGRASARERPRRRARDPRRRPRRPRRRRDVRRCVGIELRLRRDVPPQAHPREKSRARRSRRRRSRSRPATTSPTTTSSKRRRDHIVLTSPKYVIGDPASASICAGTSPTRSSAAP